MSHNITVKGGKSVRLPTAGKYCDRDIIVTAEGGGGGDPALEGIIINGIEGNAEAFDTSIQADFPALVVAVLPNATSIDSYAIQDFEELEIVRCPQATSMGTRAFYNCATLREVYLPMMQSVNTYGFMSCTALEKINLPAATSLEVGAFGRCYSLSVADFSSLETIRGTAFTQCFSLRAVILRSSTMCSLAATNIFTKCHRILGTVDATYNPNGLRDGYTYVPRNLLQSYETDEMWSASGTQFRALEDFTVDGTTDGELDPAKVFGGGEVVEPIIEPLEVTENGTYTAPEGVDGYSPITVNVASNDGGLEALITNTLDKIESGVSTIRGYCFYGCTALTSASFHMVASIPTYGFYGCTKLASVSFPMATGTGNYAFRGCTVLKTLDLPLIKTLGTHTFYACSSLTSVKFPLVTAITSNLFYGCAKMKTVDIPAKSVAASAFANNYTLTALILRGTTMATLANTNAFTGCYHLLGTKNTTYNPNALKDCYIYVPSELVSSYQTASNWSTYSTQFRALEDYTVDGTIDGELDPIKVASGGSGGSGSGEIM